MPIYVGDLPIDDLLDETGDGYDIVYLGSDQVWPPITFPYVVEGNFTGAEVPSGAVGVIPELIGGGGPGDNGQTMPSQNNVVAAGGNGGGGGAAIGSVGLRFFIPVEDLGSTFTTLVGPGVASRFISGGIDLIAGAGTDSAGGTAIMTGIGYGFSSPGAGPGADNGTGGAGGGGKGRTAQTDSNKNVTYSAGTKGGDSMTKAGGPYTSPDPLPDAGQPSGGAGGRGASAFNARGYGAGGPGGTGKIGTGSSGTEGGLGGPGYLRLTWTDKRHAFARFTAAGAWSWTLPSWLHNGDKVVLSAHGGGRGGTNGGSTSAGQGGQAGQWADVALTVGVDIAPGATLVGSIGAEGASNGGNGGNTSCTTVGLTALGATASNGTTASNGDSLANHTALDGDLYLGGLGGAYVATQAGLDGGPGSGGGAGGSLFFQGKAGGKGGGGRLFIHAYQV